MTKQRSQLDPYTAPDSFRHYGYDSVILKWETVGTAAVTNKKFDARKLSEQLKVRIKAFRKLQEIQLAENRRDPDGEFINFYYKSPACLSLFKTLRNTFAHGHYGSPKRNWIVLKHEFKGPRDKSATVRLYGRMTTKNLKQLIDSLESKEGDR